MAMAVTESYCFSISPVAELIEWNPRVDQTCQRCPLPLPEHHLPPCGVWLISISINLKKQHSTCANGVQGMWHLVGILLSVTCKMQYCTESCSDFIGRWGHFSPWSRLCCIFCSADTSYSANNLLKKLCQCVGLVCCVFIWESGTVVCQWIILHHLKVSLRISLLMASESDDILIQRL
jgi:hypothetical protein